MAKSLFHRGPDDQGLWQDPDVPLVLGHRRLAIIDLTPEGHQPMLAASGRYVIVFNGEIYNFMTLRRELEAQGAGFRGRSDTEVMLAAFDHWGVNRTVQKLNGMFAFALWDRTERKLHLVRDRMGKKPLYYGWAGGAFVFGSELKALRAHPDFQARVHRGALSLYMRYGCVPAPHCIYDGVWQVPAGCRVVIAPETQRPGSDLAPLIESYWNHRQVVEQARLDPLTLDDDQAVSAFEDLLSACVRDRLMADVPLGAFLSGGIDSSVITALMQKMSAQPVKTFTIGFEDADFDEAAHARAVAQHLGTQHHELYCSPQDAQAIIPRLPDMYDEPFADESQIPTFMVSRFAAQSVTVALSGDGGDDLLGGYTRHVTVPPFWAAVGWMPQAARQTIARGLRLLDAGTLARVFPGIPRVASKTAKLADILCENNAQDIFISLVGRWHDPARLVVGGTEPAIRLRDPSWLPANLNFTEQLLYGDQIYYLPDELMTKTDRASMAASLEARAPLLDPRLYEFSWRLPLHQKIRGGKGKWILRQVLRRHLPAALFERPKRGFAVPLGSWLDGPLRGWAEDLLDEGALRQQGYFDPAPIRAQWENRRFGTNPQRLWTVLMFQSWRARWGL